MKVLAGDIGGTKTLLQIAEVRGTHIETLHQARFVSQDYPDFADLLGKFLAQAPTTLRNNLTAACFGVAGPITGPEGSRRARITNLPWSIDEVKLKEQLQQSRVRLINDFYATASGIEALDDEDLATLHAAEAQPTAPRLVVGAGTGLGVAQLFWCNDRYRAFASEGGHIHFAPTDALQMELLAYMQKQHERVSYERLVSGGGLVLIHRFLMQREQAAAAAVTQPSLEDQDPAAAVVDLARSGDTIARQALSLFISIYGAIVGDLALISLAYGGVYIAGGIAPKLQAELSEGTFMHAFGQKGRMSSLVIQMPVSIILSQNVGLLGASLVASQL